MDRRSLIFVIALVITFFFINLWFSSSRPKTQSLQHKKPIEAFKDEFSVPMGPIASPAISKSSTDEEYFVLQNDYQQVVFSNIGGSIAAINLPFQSNENPKSFVRPIHLDRIFLDKHTINDHFPSFSY